MEPSRPTIISEKELHDTMSYFKTLGLKADLPAHENPDRKRQTVEFQLNKKYVNSLAVVNCRAE